MASQETPPAQGASRAAARAHDGHSHTFDCSSVVVQENQYSLMVTIPKPAARNIGISKGDELSPSVDAKTDALVFLPERDDGDE